MKTKEAALLLWQTIHIFYIWNYDEHEYTPEMLKAKFYNAINNPELYYKNMAKLMDLLKIGGENITQVKEWIESFDHGIYQWLEYFEDDIYSEYLYPYDISKYNTEIDLSKLNPEDLYLDDPENAHWD